MKSEHILQGLLKTKESMVKKKSDNTPVVIIAERDCLGFIKNTMIVDAMTLACVESHSVLKNGLLHSGRRSCINTYPSVAHYLRASFNNRQLFYKENFHKKMNKTAILFKICGIFFRNLLYLNVLYKESRPASG